MAEEIVQPAGPSMRRMLAVCEVEETDENWQRNIAKLLELQPECVTIYQMEVPYNTSIFKQMEAEGKLVAPVADWHTKRRWVNEAFAALEANGYTVTSATTAVRDPQRTKFVYRDELWKGADLLGLGVAILAGFGGDAVGGRTVP